MMRTCKWLWTIVPVAIIGVVGGCGAGDETTVKPAATIVIDGSSTVFRISKAAQEMFNSIDADTTVVVDNHGTGGGFKHYLEGEVDIVDASRAAKADEESQAKERGIEWSRFVVGLRRDHAGCEPQERLRQVAHRRAVEIDLGAWEQGQDAGRTSIPPGRPETSFSIRRTTTRGRSSFSPRRSSASPRASATTCRQAPTTTRWSTAWPAIRTAWVISATRTSRPTKTSFAPWPCKMGRPPSPFCPALPRSPTSHTLRCRDHCSFT